MKNEDKKTILIIDDDLTIRKLLGHHLKSNNYKVLEATGPEEGFSHLKNNNIDLVLCDVTMDEMDGFTFCKKVRENENYRVLPFVFVTAKSTIEDKSMAMEVGGDDIITKPFDINELLLKVNALLKRTAIYKVYGVKQNLNKSFEEERKKILLVDDDIAVVKLFEYNLTQAGFDCASDTKAENAIDLAKSFMPDLIISDIMMPEMDGFEFRKEILNDPSLKSVPFIFLTAKSEEKDVLDGYDLGINDYIIKTAGPKVLVAKVNALLKSLGKERQKVVSELHNAADSLRVKVVPDKTPVFQGYQIKQWHQAYHGIPGGDFIDYFKLDEDHIAIVLGDVMGKKWGAWYFAFAYAGYVRSAIRVAIQTSKIYTPSKIIQQVNKSVYEDAKVSEVFATLSILILNKKDQKLLYAGAGDLPIIHKNNITGKVDKIRCKGSLLGFMENGGFEDSEITLNNGDFVILLTDGIIESRNDAGEQFGKCRLNEVLENLNSDDNPLKVIKEEFDNFTGGKYEDDISIITIKKE